MGLTTSSVGVTAGPTWATNEQTNLTTLDNHDHTSGKGVQLGPSSLNINADLEFNQNSASELKNVIFDSSVTAASTNYSLYQSSGNVYWRNGSGTAVQITDGSAVNTSGGSISGMSANAQVLFSSNAYVFKFDSTLSDPGIAKLGCADITMYKYDASGSAANVTLKFLGSGTTGVLTVPDETGTLLSTATSFAGTISVATSASNASITLSPHGTGHVVAGNGGATGKITSNGAYDLILDTNSGTNSSSIAITDNSNGNISLIPNGTGEIVIGSGSSAGKITSSGAHDLVLDTNAGSSSSSITITDAANGNIALNTNGTGEVVVCAGSASVKITSSGTYDLVLDTNAGTNSGTITITDGANGDITIACNGTGDIECSSDVKTSTTKKVYSKGNCYQTSFHSSLVFGY